VWYYGAYGSNEVVRCLTMELDLKISHMNFNNIVVYGRLEWTKRMKASLGDTIRNITP
jgi:hypothetical protein